VAELGEHCPKGLIVQPALIQTSLTRSHSSPRLAVLAGRCIPSERAFAAEAPEVPRLSARRTNTAATRRIRMTGSFPEGGSPAVSMAAEPDLSGGYRAWNRVDGPAIRALAQH
jgi:hypothetical protein